MAEFDFDLRMQLPNHALYIGPSQAGKTRLALYLLSNPQLFNPKPKQILFYFDQWQDCYVKMQQKLACEGIKFRLIKGCSKVNLDAFEKSEGQTIICIDDFSEETSSSQEIARIATNGRHKNLSLWLIWHSLFTKYPASRIITQNVRYLFFLPALRLESQLASFGNQLGMKKAVLSAYHHCIDDTSDPYRYLLVDAGPLTPRMLCLRSKIHRRIQYCFV